MLPRRVAPSALVLGALAAAVQPSPPGAEFLAIASGTCEGLGSCVSAGTPEQCAAWGTHLAEVANRSAPASGALNPSPLGCYLYKATGKLYYNGGQQTAQDCSVDRRCLCRCAEAIDVAFYHDLGATARAKNNVYAVMNYEGDMRVHNFSAAMVGSLLRKDYHDVVVFPGGSAGEEGTAIGSQGQAAVRAFIAAGGGYVGICAGAFLAINQLQLVPVHAGGMRGDGNCSVSLADGGLAGYGVDAETLATQPIFYANGPTMKFNRSKAEAEPNSTDFRVLATYTSAVPMEKKYPSDDPEVSGNGLAAVVAATWAGRGTVVISGPHPETEQMDFPDRDGPPASADDVRARLLQSYVRYAAAPQPPKLSSLTI